MEIYLDNASTTALDDEVFELMLPYMKKYYGNASSGHSLGEMSAIALNESKYKISELLNCNPNEIYFTSGGSESNNWAIKGIAEANIDRGNHIITSQIEHKSVLSSCKYLEEKGYDVTYLPVDKNGIVSLEALKKAITKKTILISIMSANNEIGTLQPIDEISEIAFEHNIFFHTDAVQAINRIPSLIDSKIDLLSLSAHKFSGPKGIGILYVRKNTPITPYIHGGFQQNGLRAGTENIANIVGAKAALEKSFANRRHKEKYVKELKNLFISKIKHQIPDVIFNSPQYSCLSNMISIQFKTIDAIKLVTCLNNRGIYVSNGAACNCNLKGPSHVLKAIGLSDEEALSSVRISLGYNNTEEDILSVVAVITQELKTLS